MGVAKWTVWIEASRPDGVTERIEIAAIERDLSSPRPEDLGFGLPKPRICAEICSRISRWL